MYDGNCVLLQAFLRQNTSHPYPAWLDNDNTTSTPVQFRIEVKTTTGPCSTPFFTSMNQHKSMQRYKMDRSRGTHPPDVYVIARVYKLLTSKIGMELFIDPWHLKDDVLEFVADPWKVIAPEP
jgi:hypothetical protein